MNSAMAVKWPTAAQCNGRNFKRLKASV